MDTILGNMRDALCDKKNLPRALIWCGASMASAALCLAFFKEPGGVFLHHGKAPFYLYYGILVAVVIFGLAEAFAGFWMAAGDLNERHAVGKTIMWVSILPLVFVVATGGFAIMGKVN